MKQGKKCQKLVRGVCLSGVVCVTVCVEGGYWRQFKSGVECISTVTDSPVIIPSHTLPCPAASTLPSF